MKVFISHSSKDKKIVDSFITNILILGCGIDENNIFCTSVEGLGIKTGEEFRCHILQNLVNSNYSFLLISNNYKRSDICLNEMGASWALNDIKVKPFLLPGIDFNSIGTLYNVKHAARIIDPYALDELFSEITEETQIEKKISRWNKSKENFIHYVKSMESTTTESVYPSPNEFFTEFVQENSSLNHILLRCHPTLLDCKKIFDEKYYKRCFEIYCNLYVDLIEKPIEPLYPEHRYFRIKESTTTGILSGNDDVPGGMVKAVKHGIFNYNIKFYQVEFLESESSQFGISYYPFCYINGRWVFIPKPYFKEIF